MMNIQAMFDAMNNQHATSCEGGQWTLGMLVDALEKYPSDTKIGISAEIESYRGYYNHLSINPGESTVGDLLLRLKAALDGEVFTGYKGGDYTYTRKTPVWVADYGYSGPYFAGLNDYGSGLSVVTKASEE